MTFSELEIGGERGGLGKKQKRREKRKKGS
jgi:hypothetical protein